LDGRCQPWYLDLAPSGNLIVTDIMGRVLEVTMDDKILWQKDGLASPCCAKVLPNGNIAVLESGRSGQISIYDKSSNIVDLFWQEDFDHRLRYFDVLSNGNILVFISEDPTGDNSLMREIDPQSGKTVAEIKIKKGSLVQVSGIDRD